jgi:hypothetical protein
MSSRARRRGDLAKILWHDGGGLSLYAKRLDRGKFIWPSAKEGVVSISAAQMAYMLEGIDWRNPGSSTWFVRVELLFRRELKRPIAGRWPLRGGQRPSRILVSLVDQLSTQMAKVVTAQRRPRPSFIGGGAAVRAKGSSAPSRIAMVVAGLPGRLTCRTDQESPAGSIRRCDHGWRALSVVFTWR